MLAQAPEFFLEGIDGLVCQSDADLICNGTVSNGLFFFA
jgi:hypothetical protein